jgi:hypothetical protein
LVDPNLAKPPFVCCRIMAINNLWQFVLSPLQCLVSDIMGRLVPPEFIDGHILDLRKTTLHILPGQFVTRSRCSTFRKAGPTRGDS